MEMSQRIHFWYQISLKMLIFEKMAKNMFLIKNFCEAKKKNILS